MADGVYGFDPEIQDVDSDGEESDRARRDPAASPRPPTIQRRPDQRRRHHACAISDATAADLAQQPGRRARPSPP